MSTSSSLKIKNVTVIGAGLMGAGIVQVAAQSGLQVTMVDISDQLLEKGKSIISSSLNRVAKKQYLDSPDAQNKFIRDVFSNISTTTDSIAAVKDADLVIEAIVESLSKKQQLFAKLDMKAPSKTIFASNTSSLPIAEIAAVTNRKDRFAGLHFFNPVPQMKLVEIIRTEHTTQATFEELKTLIKVMGKVGVECKDTPGFIVNRLLVPCMMEALRLVERGEASKQDVDIAMKLGAGYPMGPFELADYIGLDTLKFICDGWYESSKELAGDKLVAPSNTLNELVKKGHLGRKSGKGFYDYSSKV